MCMYDMCVFKFANFQPISLAYLHHMHASVSNRDGVSDFTRENKVGLAPVSLILILLSACCAECMQIDLLFHPLG